MLKNFTDDSNVFNLTPNVVDLCIEIRKKHKTKLPDALIAATALANDLILLSRNVSDFKNLSRLKVINPHNSI